MQQPSSLIFLAIVLIWAVYLLQHWIRRREALATARSVDQFSESMRVLERRTRTPEGIAFSEDSPHVSRPSAPQVSVKLPRPSLRAGTVMTGDSPKTTSNTTQSAPATGAQTSGGAGAKLGSGMQSLRHAWDAAARMGSPKLRLGALIGCAALLIITVVCAPFGAVPWWSPLLALVLTAGVVMWCRASVRAAAHNRAQRRPAAPRPAVRSSRNVEQAPVRTQQPTRSPAQQTSETTRPQQPVRQEAAVFDVTAQQDAPAARPVVRERREAIVEDVEIVGVSTEQWQPVAVPRPTYTMKAKAEREPVEPAATVDEVDTRPLAARYENTPVEDLPFDGMALDEDYEELPQVYRAG